MVLRAADLFPVDARGKVRRVPWKDMAHPAGVEPAQTSLRRAVLYPTELRVVRGLRRLPQVALHYRLSALVSATLWGHILHMRFNGPRQLGKQQAGSLIKQPSLKVADDTFFYAHPSNIKTNLCFGAACHGRQSANA